MRSLPLAVLRSLLALLMLVFSALVFLQVMIRYVVDLGLFGLNDVISLIAVWMYFLGAAYAAYAGKHIVASLVDVILPMGGSMQRSLDIATSVITAAIMLVFAWWAGEYTVWTHERGAVSSELKLPRLFFAIPIALGCLLMGVFFLQNAFTTWRGARGRNGDG